MTDLMAHVEDQMDHVHAARRREWRMQQSYYRFRTRRPWKWLPRRVRPWAFRLFGEKPGG